MSFLEPKTSLNIILCYLHFQGYGVEAVKVLVLVHLNKNAW